MWFGGPGGVHRAAFDAALEAGAPVGGPGLVVWGLGQPFERYTPPFDVALEHARQCVVRAHVLMLQGATAAARESCDPAGAARRIAREADRLGRPLLKIELAPVEDVPAVVDKISDWLIAPRPHLYVVGGEQAPPMSPFYRRAHAVILQTLRRFPRPASA